jgi:membrane protein implicated in regulation of membrane protease activity
LTQRWKLSVPLRYALFQIPGVILLGLGLAAAVRWWGLSMPTTFMIIGLWIVKDILMFPILKRAYESNDSSLFDRVGGSVGLAQQALDPSGYVRVGAELWRAELAAGSAPVAAGSAVRVIEVRGMTLFVEPMPPEEGS